MKYTILINSINRDKLLSSKDKSSLKERSPLYNKIQAV